jgi:DNA-binding transcriptional LysR family regulator
MQVVRERASRRLRRRAGAIRDQPLGSRAGRAIGRSTSGPHTRKLSLTHAEEQLYQTAESAFDTLDTGPATLAHYRQTPSGTVRINASQHAIDKCLLPKLAIFKQRYPDIRLELINESRFVDIIAERFDAGVDWGRKWGRE